MKSQNFERELPSGYKLVKHINAKDVKLGLIFNGVCLLLIAAVLALAWIPLIGRDLSVFLSDEEDLISLLVAWVVLIVVMILYIVLHEMAHGTAYKALTGEKLTFGMSWSCAFCGVPSIYTYRRTAIISLIAPLTVFGVIFLPLTVWLYFVNPIYYLLSAFMLGMHLGGCSGDIYCTLLFLFKYKDKKTLMRDTGPQQYLYVPEE